MTGIWIWPWERRKALSWEYLCTNNAGPNGGMWLRLRSKLGTVRLLAELTHFLGSFSVSFVHVHRDGRGCAVVTGVQMYLARYSANNVLSYTSRDAPYRDLVTTRVIDVSHADPRLSSDALPQCE